METGIGWWDAETPAVIARRAALEDALRTVDRKHLQGVGTMRKPRVVVGQTFVTSLRRWWYPPQALGILTGDAVEGLSELVEVLQVSEDDTHRVLVKASDESSPVFGRCAWVYTETL